MSGLADIIKNAKAQGPVAQDFKCKYCDKGFARESTLSAHICEKKRRHQQKNEVGVRMGFQAWLRFYELTQGSNKDKSYDDFVNSSFYIAFTKFGRHMCSINAINPNAFIDWVIKNNKKLDQWCKDSFYNDYLWEYLRKENPQDALERAIIEMQHWADENNSVLNHFFLYVNTNRLCSMITNGRISPWVIYGSASGQAALEKLNDEQLQIVYTWIDPEFWQRRINKHVADIEWVREILLKSGF